MQRFGSFIGRNANIIVYGVAGTLLSHSLYRMHQSNVRMEEMRLKMAKLDADAENLQKDTKSTKTKTHPFTKALMEQVDREEESDRVKGNGRKFVENTSRYP